MEEVKIFEEYLNKKVQDWNKSDIFELSEVFKERLTNSEFLKYISENGSSEIKPIFQSATIHLLKIESELATGAILKDFIENGVSKEKTLEDLNNIKDNNSLSFITYLISIFSIPEFSDVNLEDLESDIIEHLKSISSIVIDISSYNEPETLTLLVELLDSIFDVREYYWRLYNKDILEITDEFKNALENIDALTLSLINIEEKDEE